jgi:hypothetical protein
MNVYKQMYYDLAGKVSDAIELLQNAQLQTEDTHGGFEGVIVEDGECLVDSHA